jgi:hypothetical protein
VPETTGPVPGSSPEILMIPRGFDSASSIVRMGLGCLVAAFVGCKGGDTSAYVAAMESGTATIPWVQEFAALFPHAEHSIVHHSGESGETLWQSQVQLRGRYTLTMELQIDLDGKRRQVVRFGEPFFVLVQTLQSESRADGTVVERHGTFRKFGASEWEKLRKANGEMAVILD